MKKKPTPLEISRKFAKIGKNLKNVCVSLPSNEEIIKAQAKLSIEYGCKIYQNKAKDYLIGREYSLQAHHYTGTLMWNDIHDGKRVFQKCYKITSV